MQYAQLQWINNQPFSLDFNDVYYSVGDNAEHGLLETEHVFIQQNELIERFSSVKNVEFTIIETGFGTGLNFFCAVQHWLAHAPAVAQLRFLSIELYPLTFADFTKANLRWPQFSGLLDILKTQYSKLKPGANKISLRGSRVLLELWIGDVNIILPQIKTPADAWFLDGFAPSKNADMWSENLFKQITRLSLPNTTFATFTSAGHVRRQLQAAGFKVGKVAGFGKKREMLSGIFSAPVVLP